VVFYQVINLLEVLWAQLVSMDVDLDVLLIAILAVKALASRHLTKMATKSDR
jgi:hypothetical protein